MRTKRLTSFLVLIIGFSLTTSGVLAQARFGDRHGPGRGGQGGILMILKAKQDELNITDEQLDKIKELMLTQEEKALKHKKAQAELSLELKKLMLGRENLDYGKLKQILSHQSEARNDMFIQRLKDRDEITAVLTPEQQEALKSLRSDRFLEGRRSMRDHGRQRIPRPNRLHRDFKTSSF